jgi:hypothetical protein
MTRNNPSAKVFSLGKPNNLYHHTHCKEGKKGHKIMMMLAFMWRIVFA